MSIVWSDVGIESFLSDLVDTPPIATTTFSVMAMGLYTNNYTPTQSDNSISAFTQPTNTGYAATSVGGFGAVSIVAHTAFASTGAVVFNFTAGAAPLLYGKLLYRISGSIYYGAELFPGGPFTLPAVPGQWVDILTATEYSGSIVLACFGRAPFDRYARRRRIGRQLRRVLSWCKAVRLGIRRRP